MNWPVTFPGWTAYTATKPGFSFYVYFVLKYLCFIGLCMCLLF